MVSSFSTFSLSAANEGTDMTAKMDKVKIFL
jgi:hypothetical protein